MENVRFEVEIPDTGSLSDEEKAALVSFLTRDAKESAWVWLEGLRANGLEYVTSTKFSGLNAEEG
ncbi:hypothetical protein GCM10010423_64790 [Streptomyces levis]|uniref:Uncharacterized protein n=1 Tax=Streptomyces levis TaxID=285566 RepID=A0ABN3P162_9ACTN